MAEDFNGLLEGFTSEEAYDEYDLRNGIEYCEGWVAEGEVRDQIGNFDLMEFRAWCLKKLKERYEIR